MAEFYPADYQPFNAPLEKQDRPPWFEGLRSLAGRFLDTKEHLLPTGLPPGKALEVGCGSGRYLARLAAEGWIVQGLDPSATTVENLRATTGLPVTVGDIDGAEFEVGFFDLIAAVMVLEHLHDPLANIRKLHSWIRPGGYLSGSVPNCGSWEFRFFGRSWYALQVPTHLFHFTPETLTTLLERAGFGDVRIAQQRNVSNLMVHAGRFLARHHLPFSSTFLEFPERGSRMLRYSVRPAASILAWARQAGRISFLARKDDPNTNME